MSPWDTVDATHERLGCVQGVPDAADGVDEGRVKGGVDRLAQVAKVDVDCYRLSTLTLPGTVRVPGASEERNGKRLTSQRGSQFQRPGTWTGPPALTTTARPVRSSMASALGATPTGTVRRTAPVRALTMSTL